MIFYGNGVVWDPKNSRKLMKFVNGMFETEDEHIIEQLTKAGYEYDAASEVEEEAEVEGAPNYEDALEVPKVVKPVAPVVRTRVAAVRKGRK